MAFFDYLIPRIIIAKIVTIIVNRGKNWKAFWSGFKMQVYAVPMAAAAIVLVTFLLNINPEDFPYDNARYAYSAVFQGFAAIMAIMITAILITLQNIHSQKFGIEERIYKILGERYPTYIPDTIDQIELDIETPVFEEQFRRYVNENREEFTFAQAGLLIHRVREELRRKFIFLNEQTIHTKKLRRIFKISLAWNIIILVYSLTALLIAVPSDSAPFTTGINPIHAIFICAILVLIALEMFAIFFVEIVKIMHLSPE